MVAQQHAGNNGIFACDSTAVLCTEPWTLAPGVEALQFMGAEVGVSSVGFAANAKLFSHAWRAIRDDGRYQQFDWTLKVDPDAVLLPSRLWRTLGQHTGKKTFVNNCGMFNISAMYGSVEAISKSGLDEFFLNFEDKCSWMLWRAWGEDLYMQKCFKQSGVVGVTELGIVSDQRCWDSALPESQGCKDTIHPVFHPFKSLRNWSRCLNESQQADAEELRERAQEEKARREQKATNLREQKERAMAQRKKQAAAAAERHHEEDRRHAAKAKAELEARLDAKKATKAVNSTVADASASDSDVSLDDRSSNEYSIALAKSKVVKELLNVGYTVRVRDIASQRWRPGNVTSLNPVAVRPQGWTVGFTWDIVDLIPFTAKSDLVRGDRVIIAEGQKNAPDVQEGPLKADSRGVVVETRNAVISGEMAVLIEALGRQWWYRGSSIALEKPEVQTCSTIGCQVTNMAADMPALPSLPGYPAATVKRRLQAGDSQPAREMCRCDSGCVAVGRCCGDYVDVCVMTETATMMMAQRLQ